jgi:hypothetical protein
MLKTYGISQFIGCFFAVKMYAKTNENSVADPE